MSDEELLIDLVEDILVRLDAEDLIRCKRVCKSWLSLICSTRFVKNHLDYACNKDHNNHELGHRRIIMPSYKNTTLNDGKILYDEEYLGHDWYIVGSCNGLICLSLSTVNAQVLVTNPLTKEVKILRNPPQIPNLTYGLNRYLLCWGFGYDSLTNDYKVVMGIRRGKVGTNFLMLSLKSNTWKVITFAKYKIIGRIGILWNGALHWYMKDCNTKKIVILSFHLSGQQFTEIPQPDDDSRYLFDYLYFLGIADKCLCIYRNYSPVQRWVMKTYNDKQSWELMPDGCEMKYDIAHTLKSYYPHKNCYFLPEDGKCVSETGKFIGSRIFVPTLISPHLNGKPKKKHTMNNKRSAKAVCNYNVISSSFVFSRIIVKRKRRMKNRKMNGICFGLAARSST